MASYTVHLKKITINVKLANKYYDLIESEEKHIVPAKSRAILLYLMAINDYFLLSMNVIIIIFQSI